MKYFFHNDLAIEVARWCVKAKQFSGTVPLRTLFRLETNEAKTLLNDLVTHGIIKRADKSVTFIPAMEPEELEWLIRIYREREEIDITRLSKAERNILICAIIKEKGFINVKESRGDIFDYVGNKEGVKYGILVRGRIDIYEVLSAHLKRQNSDTGCVILMGYNSEQSEIELANHLHILYWDLSGLCNEDYSADKWREPDNSIKQKALHILTTVNDEKYFLEEVYLNKGISVSFQPIYVEMDKRDYVIELKNRNDLQMIKESVKKVADIVKKDLILGIDKKQYVLRVVDKQI